MMNTKDKTVLLSYPHMQNSGTVEEITSGETVYRVEKISNTTEFLPGTMLTKMQVDHLCSRMDIGVTIAQKR